MTKPATSTPVASLQGEITVPGDKSISHRALLLSSQVIGSTEIHGLLEGDDVLNTAKALRQLGVPVEKARKVWRVQGVGVGGLKESADVLDMGNSGTGARLLMGLLATHPILSFFTGDASLSKRPMGRVMVPLSEIGAEFKAREGKFLPLSMQGTAQGMPITYTLPVASAQVKSAVLLAGLNVRGTTTVVEPEATRDHCENMLKYFGFKLSVSGNSIALQGQYQPPRKDHVLHIPADPSSAAFPIVASLISKDSHVLIKNVCINQLRIGLYVTLKEMGAAITYENEREVCGEKVADIRVRSSKLKGVKVPASRAPSMIDEYPILAVAAAFAEGETVMEGLHELRVKESDRLAVMAENLQACGVDAYAEGDTLRVRGGRVKGGATIKTHLDHRIAMSFLVLGTASEQPVTVDDAAAIATSFPDFERVMNSLGANISSEATRRLVIAVDGPAASGKGTLARRLAEHYGLTYLDTGSLYRAVGMKVEYAGKDPADKKAALKAAQEIDLEDLANPRLRQEHIGHAASVVSAMPEVRAALLDFQRNVAASNNGAVLDGRDIGTVVCPDADVKLYLTATLEARAKRRHRELSGQGVEVVFESVKADLEERDARDAKRAIAPLKPAQDAVVIDTSTMDANSVFERAKKIVDEI